MPTSVLSDGTIRRLVAEGAVRIDPWDPDMVQPGSVDLRLAGSFRVFHNFRVPAIDLADPPTNLTEHIEVPEGEQFVIHPGSSASARRRSGWSLPDDVVASIEGKSSLGASA
jgi:dCTP deaminase